MKYFPMGYEYYELLATLRVLHQFSCVGNKSKSKFHEFYQKIIRLNTTCVVYERRNI